MIDTELTEKQKTLLRSLASTSNIAQAAKLSNIPDKTARRWLSQPAFKTALDLARSANQDQDSTPAPAEPSQPDKAEIETEQETPDVTPAEPLTIVAEQPIATPVQPTELDYAQMVKNAESTIAALEAEQTALSARLEAIKHERATICAQRTTRTTQIDNARRNVQRAQEDLDTQEAAARLATGTSASLASNAPIDSLRTHVKRLDAELSALANRDQIQDEQDTARTTSLDTDEANARSRFGNVQRELTATTRVKADTLTAWGQYERRQSVVTLGLADVVIDDLERQLQLAKLSKLAAYEKRLEVLAKWPDHQSDVRHMIPLNDPVTSALEAAMVYVDALLCHGRQLPVSLNLDSMGKYYHVLDSLLHVPNDEIFGYQTVRDRPQWLQERRSIMERVLIEYRLLKG